MQTQILAQINCASQSSRYLQRIWGKSSMRKKECEQKSSVFPFLPHSLIFCLFFIAKNSQIDLKCAGGKFVKFASFCVRVNSQKIQTNWYDSE